MFCYNCGNPIDGNVNFCSRCGVQLPSQNPGTKIAYEIKPQKDKNSKVWIWILLSVILIGVGVAVYVVLNGDKELSVEEKKEKDNYSAAMIKTSVETAMGNEIMYEDLTITYANKLIEVSENGLNVLPDNLSKEIHTNLGEIPTCYSAKENTKYFSFMVDQRGNVYVYDANGNRLR